MDGLLAGGWRTSHGGRARQWLSAEGRGRRWRGAAAADGNSLLLDERGMTGTRVLPPSRLPPPLSPRTAPNNRHLNRRLRAASPPPHRHLTVHRHLTAANRHLTDRPSRRLTDVHRCPPTPQERGAQVASLDVSATGQLVAVGDSWVLQHSSSARYSGCTIRPPSLTTVP